MDHHNDRADNERADNERANDERANDEHHILDVSNDEIRRQARASQAEHEMALPKLREALSRLFDDPTDGGMKSRLAMGFDRRSVLRIGGIGILGAAVMAACSDDSSSGGSGASTSIASATTMAPTGSGTAMAGDVMILRTASSIEELAVAAYQTAIDSGLVETAAIGDAAKMFQAQHREHSALFQSLTKAAGGVPFTMPNPTLLAAITPTVKALADEMGIVALAFDLETIAAQTYQSNVAMFSDAKLNAAIMSVGGVESRHAAILAGVLGQPPVPKAFQVTDKAVAAGTGV